MGNRKRENTEKKKRIMGLSNLYASENALLPTVNALMSGIQWTYSVTVPMQWQQ